jgi:hypothetical protein
MIISVQIDSTSPTQHPPGSHARAAVLGEVINFALPNGLALAATQTLVAPDGADLQLQGRTMAPDRVGRYHVRFIAGDGQRGELRLVVAEPEALAALPHGPSANGAHDRRGTLQSLAAHADWFTGTKLSLANQNLSMYGA